MEDPQDQAFRREIAERLTLLIERFELSGAKVKAIAKLNTESSVTQWKKGDTIPAWETAVRLCQSLGVTLDWIYRGDRGSLPASVYERLYGFRAPRTSRSKRRRPFQAAE